MIETATMDLARDRATEYLRLHALTNERMQGELQHLLNEERRACEQAVARVNGLLIAARERVAQLGGALETVLVEMPPLRMEGYREDLIAEGQSFVDFLRSQLMERGDLSELFQGLRGDTALHRNGELTTFASQIENQGSEADLEDLLLIQRRMQSTEFPQPSLWRDAWRKLRGHPTSLDRQRVPLTAFIEQIEAHLASMLGKMPPLHIAAGAEQLRRSRGVLEEMQKALQMLGEYLADPAKAEREERDARWTRLQAQAHRLRDDLLDLERRIAELRPAENGQAPHTVFLAGKHRKLAKHAGATKAEERERLLRALETEHTKLQRNQSRNQRETAELAALRSQPIEETVDPVILDGFQIRFEALRDTLLRLQDSLEIPGLDESYSVRQRMHMNASAEELAGRLVPWLAAEIKAIYLACAGPYEQAMVACAREAEGDAKEAQKSFDLLKLQLLADAIRTQDERAVQTAWQIAGISGPVVCHLWRLMKGAFEGMVTPDREPIHTRELTIQPPGAQSQREGFLDIFASIIALVPAYRELMGQRTGGA